MNYLLKISTAVDWPNQSDYATVARNIHAVAEGIARMIIYLNQHLGCPMSLIHIIGHSLGAHVAGMVGAALQGAIPRITGKQIKVFQSSPTILSN